jgi:ATP-dependent DNA helicase RecG
LTDLPPDLQKQLTELKKRENKRQVICNLILALCAFHPMTKKELSTYLNRKENYLKHEFLQPLINNKKLKYLYPEVIRHPYQAYITNGNISVSD